MLVLYGVLMMAIGLWQAIWPEATLWNDRWRYRRGEELELSDEYRGWLRFGGIVGVLIGVAMIGGSIAMDQQEKAEARREDQRAAVDAVWGIARLPDDEESVWGGIQIVDVPVRREPARPLAGTFLDLRYGVIGSSAADPEVEFEGEQLLPINSAADGDLVLGIQPYVTCRLTAVTVEETESTVVIGVEQEVEIPTPTYAWETPNDDDPCSGFTPTGDIDLVHIPLDQPLGDRQVIDGRTGEAALPVPVD